MVSRSFSPASTFELHTQILSRHWLAQVFQTAAWVGIQHMSPQESTTHDEQTLEVSTDSTLPNSSGWRTLRGKARASRVYGMLNSPASPYSRRSCILHVPQIC